MKYLQSRQSTERAKPARFPLIAGVALVSLLHATISLAASSITYVQSNFATPQSSQTTVTVIFTAAQAAGDLNVVAVGWNDTTATVSSVTDKSGNVYARAVGPTVQTGIASQSIYYAKNIAAAAAGANVVTVTFSRAAVSADIRILEYKGADLSTPVDVTAASSGSSATSSSGSVTTTNPTDLIFGANLVQTLTSGPGTGFTQRLMTSPDGDIAQDQMVTAKASYSSTAPLKSGQWIMQMVAFRASGTAPTVTSVSPNNGPASGGTAVTISGSNFVAGATVTFGGASATNVVVVSGTQITAKTPAGNAGAVTVAVTAAGQTGSLASGFTYILPPTVTSVSPNNGPTSGGTSVTISGSNFVAGATVTFGGASATNVVVVSGTQITAKTPAGNAGAVTVAVTAAGQTGSLASGFTYILPPTVTSVSPNNGPTSGGTSVTISGSNFVAGATVTFGGASATNVVVVSGTQITAKTPAGNAGAVTVAVTAAGQTGSLASGFTYILPPTVSGVSPNNGPTTGGTAVTITGTNFAAGATVNFGGASATNVVVVSGTSITATTPAGNAGAATVSVTVNAQSGSLTNGFTYIIPPSVSSASPSTGSTTGGTAVTITGANFAPGATVTFDGTLATNVIVVNSTTITATTPPGNAGPVTVAVTIAGQTANLTGGFSYVVIPTVSGASPNNGPTTGGTAVTITGTNFAAGATVNFGGTAASNVVVVSGTSITATTPAGNAGAATVSVTVNAQSGSLTNGFTYIIPPSVSGASPSTGSTTGGTAVTITGANFAPGATVTFDGTLATNVIVVNSTTITATTPPGNAGPVTVAVTVSGQTGSLTGGFSYVVIPTVSGASPNNGPTTGGTAVTITGTNFAAGATVNFGGTAASNVVVVSGTSITATTPAGNAGAATVSVTVNAQSGSLTNGFTYIIPPSVSGASPSTGSTTGGTAVTITGANFAPGATVTFDGTLATNVIVVNSTTITATTPPGNAGPVTVAVTVSGQTGSLTGGFSYVVIPTVSGASPNNGPTTGGTAVTITGTNFAAGATVNFGGTAATNVVVVSGTSIAATTPAGNAGAATVSVTVNAQSGSLTNGFTYIIPPTVSSASPSTGSTTGGTAVTIAGANFAPGATVTFDGTLATNVIVVNSTTITATTPPGNAGPVTVAVTIAGQTANLAGGFSYVVIPTVSGASPNNGPTTGGTAVTITGTNFAAGATVNFGGTAASNVVVVSGTQITATTPAGNAGAATVSVTVNAQSGSLTNGFTYIIPPSVSGASPSTGSTTGGTAVTITGANFAPGATVTFDGTLATNVIVVNTTTITATTPPGNAGPVTVAVTIAGQTANLTGGFSYVVIPTVSGASPNNGPTTGGTAVTITGTNFAAGATVNFGGTAASNVVVVSGTSIAATTPAGNAGAATVSVTVNGQSGSLTNGFTYIIPPTVSSASPSTGSTTGGTAVTITGANFAPGATVTFDGTLATNVIVVNTTTITATTPPGNAGPVTVAVTIAGQTANLAGGFSYVVIPTVSGASPNNGPTTGGTAVTITGTNFAAGATVNFGGTAASNVVVVSGTSITATTPAGSAGAATVSVTVNGQSGSLTNGFSYIIPPTVSSASPSTGSTTGGTVVTITGANFAPGATVTFDGTLATNVIVVNTTTITATTPPGSAGAVNVGVIIGGQTGNLINGFTYTAVTTTKITYVQGNFATPQSSQTTVTVIFTAAQAAGDLNVVAVGWNDTTATVNSVTDKSGNVYARAVGPTVQTGIASQSIYYAKNIVAAAAGANVVTVTFSRAAVSADIRILEYAGADFSNPVDVTAASSGSSSTSSSGSVTTTNPTDLIFGANLVQTLTSGPGTGFTQRLMTSPDGDIAQDQMVTAKASYSSAAPLKSGQWIMQMVAFRTASGGAASPPSAPVNLSAMAIGASQINLSWTASTSSLGLANYIVQRCQGVGCASFTQVASIGTTATTYNDSGLAANTSYTYRVRASDTAGNLSKFSNVVSASTAPDTQPPTVPMNLTATAVRSTQVNLTWMPSTDDVGVAGYQVFRNGSQIAMTINPSYADTSVTASTSYTYAVSAYDSAGNSSGQSLTSSVTTPAVSAAVPTLVQHVASGMDNQFATTLTITLPNPAGAGNALILGVRFNAAGAISSVTDDQGNNWIPGPTVTNSTSGAFVSTRMNTYFALNVISATQKITVTFSGLGGPNGNPGFPQAVLSEFYDVGTVSAFDGGSSNSSSRTTNTITTTTPGDLIYEWGTDISAMDTEYGAVFNGASITAGPGFTLLSSDLQTGSADQFMVQDAAGPINPTFSASGSDTWSSVALALQSGQAGTPPPQTGIRIVHVQHEMVAWPGHTSPVTLAFPSSGNLLVAMFTATTTFVTRITDSNGNNWVSAASAPGDPNVGPTGAQILYAANANTGPDLTSVAPALTQTCTADCNIVLYDIVGAATSPYDNSITASGDQQIAGPVTMVSLTPANPNELILSVASVYYHTINSSVGSGYVLDSVVNAFDNNGGPPGTSPSRLDMDNAFAHINDPTAAPVTFVFTTSTGTPGGITGWGSVASAFIGIQPPAGP